MTMITMGCDYCCIAVSYYYIACFHYVDNIDKLHTHLGQRDIVEVCEHPVDIHPYNSKREFNHKTPATFAGHCLPRENMQLMYIHLIRKENEVKKRLRAIACQERTVGVGPRPTTYNS